MKRFLSLCLVLAMLLGMTACGGAGNGDAEKYQPDETSPEDVREITDLMKDIRAGDVHISPDTRSGTVAAAEFGIRLIQNSTPVGDNLLLSPLSVLCALAMAANGADGETLAQMETAFGASVQELNEYLCWYLNALPQGENYSLSIANAIWVNEVSRFAANRDFLQLNADYYGADIYAEPFNAATGAHINDWVNDQTKGMIPSILDQVPPEALMYLVNALAFEAQWQNPYNTYQVHEHVFTKADGTGQTVEFMYSGENYYLEDEDAIGFIKMYEGNAYAFVALLPKEGVSPEKYLESLTGEELIGLINNAQRRSVHASMPKFETEYSAELSEVLKNMGVVDAFDPDTADFSVLGTSSEGNIYISRVLHKTFISVGELGTRAGAATVVEVAEATGAFSPEEIKEVHLDRPFVYLLIDCETGLPFFIGILADAAQ